MQRMKPSDGITVHENRTLQDIRSNGRNMGMFHRIQMAWYPRWFSDCSRTRILDDTHKQLSGTDEAEQEDSTVLILRLSLQAEV